MKMADRFALPLNCRKREPTKADHHLEADVWEIYDEHGGYCFEVHSEQEATAIRQSQPQGHTVEGIEDIVADAASEITRHESLRAIKDSSIDWDYKKLQSIIRHAIEEAHPMFVAMRKFVEYATSGDNGCFMGDLDGGSVQDKLVKLGLLVELPIDTTNEAEVETGQEYELDKLFYVAWSDYARSHLKEDKS